MSRTVVGTYDFNLFELIKNDYFGFSIVGLATLIFIALVLVFSVVNLNKNSRWIVIVLLVLSIGALVFFSCLNTIYCNGEGLLPANYIKKTDIRDRYPNFPILVEETGSKGEFYWMDLGISSFISAFSYSGALILLLLGFFLKTSDTRERESLSDSITSIK